MPHAQRIREPCHPYARHPLSSLLVPSCAAPLSFWHILTHVSSCSSTLPLPHPTTHNPHPQPHCAHTHACPASLLAGPCTKWAGTAPPRALITWKRAAKGKPRWASPTPPAPRWAATAPPAVSAGSCWCLPSNRVLCWASALSRPSPPLQPRCPPPSATRLCLPPAVPSLPCADLRRPGFLWALPVLCSLCGLRLGIACCLQLTHPPTHPFFLQRPTSLLRAAPRSRLLVRQTRCAPPLALPATALVSLGRGRSIGGMPWQV